MPLFQLESAKVKSVAAFVPFVAEGAVAVTRIGGGLQFEHASDPLGVPSDSSIDAMPSLLVTPRHSSEPLQNPVTTTCALATGSPLSRRVTQTIEDSRPHLR